MVRSNISNERSNSTDERRNSANGRSNSVNGRSNNVDGRSNSADRRSENARTTVKVTKIHGNNETDKQNNFAGNLFIEISSAKLF